MKAVLPVAGVGSRLRPHTHTTPKALVHVAGKPILGHIIDSLVPLGVDELVLVVGYLGNKIVDYVKATYPMRVHVVEQSSPKGLGHAIYLAQEAVNVPEPILVVLGDTIIQGDWQSVLFQGKSALGVARVDNPQSFGVVETDGDRVVRLVEKPAEPKSNLAIVGVYYLADSGRLFAALKRVVADGVRTRGEIQLTDALQGMVDAGEEIRTFPVESWLDCGSPDALLETNRRLLDRRQGDERHGDERRRDNVIVIPPVYISPTAQVSNCIIGPYVSIANGASVSRSVVRNTIINERAEVSDMLLTDSIIGENAGVGGRYTQLNVGDSSQLHVIG